MSISFEKSVAIGAGIVLTGFVAKSAYDYVCQMSLFQKINAVGCAALCLYGLYYTMNTQASKDIHPKGILRSKETSPIDFSLNQTGKNLETSAASKFSRMISENQTRLICTSEFLAESLETFENDSEDLNKQLEGNPENLTLKKEIRRTIKTELSNSFKNEIKKELGKKEFKSLTEAKLKDLVEERIDKELEKRRYEYATNLTTEQRSKKDKLIKTKNNLETRLDHLITIQNHQSQTCDSARPIIISEYKTNLDFQKETPRSGVEGIQKRISILKTALKARNLQTETATEIRKAIQTLQDFLEKNPDPKPIPVKKVLRETEAVEKKAIEARRSPFFVETVTEIKETRLIGIDSSGRETGQAQYAHRNDTLPLKA